MTAMPDDVPSSSREWSLEELDERLRAVRAAVAERERLEQRLETTRRHLAVLHARAGRLEARVLREKRDVDELTGATLVALVARLTGDLRERLDEETREWVVAKAHLDACRDEQEAVRADIAALERRIASDADPRGEYAELLAAKDRWLAAHDADEAVVALHEAEREGVLLDALRELEEAHWAGQVARGALTGVLHALSKAQALGRLDMVGLASSFGKFEHLDDAHRHASAANRALSRFQMELSDVAERHEAQLVMEIQGMSHFADAFLDDLVSDWVVQRRIDRSHASASIARTRVNRTIRALRARRHDVRAELERLRKARGDA